VVFVFLEVVLLLQLLAMTITNVLLTCALQMAQDTTVMLPIFHALLKTSATPHLVILPLAFVIRLQLILLVMMEIFALLICAYRRLLEDVISLR